MKTFKYKVTFYNDETGEVYDMFVKDIGIIPAIEQASRKFYHLGWTIISAEMVDVSSLYIEKLKLRIKE